MQAERLAYILEKLDRKGQVYVADLARELQVSEMTIRLDLKLLNEQGLLRRVHGGAEAVGESLYKGSIRQNLYRNAGCKMAIARAAAAQVCAGDTLFVDDSSTCLYLVRQLKQDSAKRVTLYTNSIFVAFELLDAPHICSHVIGGELAANLGSTFGAGAEKELSSLQVDLCFFSANGFSCRNGASVVGYAQMKLKKAMLSASRKHILLVDSHKFGLQYLSVICSPSDIDLLITDSGVSQEILRQLKEGCSVLLAE